MRKFAYAALAGVAAISMAPAAQAAHTITLTNGSNTISGVFEHAGIEAGVFSDVFSFVLPDGVASFTATSIAVFLGGEADLDFTSIDFNGESFAVGATGIVDFRFLQNASVMSGTQNLTVNGISRGNGSYAGTIAFAAASAVPEPATWAFMIVGFGAVGASMRSARRKQKVTVSYA